MKKKILILGGTGFIGYHLAKKALKKKFSVTSISKHHPIKKRYLKNVNYIIFDITNKKLLRKNLKLNFDYVVNLAGYVDHSEKKKVYESHYLGCKAVANYFLKKEIKSFIQVGSSMEYGYLKSPQYEDLKCNPRSAYGKAKFLSTKYLLNLFEKKNFPVTILRLYQVYGTHQDLNRFIPIVINSCKNNKIFPCSHGNQHRDFLYVEDLIDAFFLILNNDKSRGQVINIGYGVPIRIKNIIKRIVNFYGAGKPQFNKIKLRKEEQMIVYPSLYKAKKILKWKPKINFITGLKKTISYYNCN
jgi:nucleoside-diphosphate-sugar epimerase